MRGKGERSVAFLRKATMALEKFGNNKEGFGAEYRTLPPGGRQPTFFLLSRKIIFVIP